MAEDTLEEESFDIPEEKHKCRECMPGAPLWMATYSDMVTLLLTFFVLLLSFAKTETAKYESALGSIRNAFGGNIFKQGEVLQMGKSPDNQATMLESKNPVRPFPIDFLTVNGLLNKHEVNRESAEDLKEMREDLISFDLADHSDIYEMPEGIKVHIRDKIFFKKDTTEFNEVNPQVFKNILELMRTGKWNLFIQGYAGREEKNSFVLSAQRTQQVAQALIERGVPKAKITNVFYGDAKASQGDGKSSDRRVDFILRKIDLAELGHKVEARGL